MNLLLTNEALASFHRLKAKNPGEAEWVRQELKKIVAEPFPANNPPDALSGVLKGLWLRKYGSRGQIIFAIDGNDAKIYAIEQDLIPEVSSLDETSVEQSQYSEEEYRHVLAQMAANRGKGDRPKVGIFWYSPVRNELFGVIAHPVDDYSRANASEGRITCSELHEDVWKKEYRKQHYKGDGTGLFVGAYQDKPRGRIFYRIDDDHFEIAAGKWLQEYPHVYEMILREFNLPAERCSARYAVHWDIGHSWR